MRQTIYRVAERVHRRGGVVSLDPNLRLELVSKERIRSLCAPVARMAEIIFPSGAELIMLTGSPTPEEGARKLLDDGARIVALKQGAAGSTLYMAENTIHIPPYTVTEVDPTGAGDCYDAALLVGIDEGWPIEMAGRFANAVGALATTRIGPMEGTFSRDQVCEFMTSQGRPLS